MGSAKPKLCPGSSQILIQYQSSDTVYNDQSMIRYLNSLYAIQGTDGARAPVVVPNGSGTVCILGLQPEISIKVRHLKTIVVNNDRF